ncbi:MAG: hypothetical protein WCJ30_27850 [Deltaproteobacteria bacterium]
MAALAFASIAGCSSVVVLDGGSIDATRPSDGSPTDTHPGVDAGPVISTKISCPADGGVGLAAALSACGVAADCAPALHGLDCCGSIIWVGINGAQQGSFAAPESACEARVGFNKCDCVARPPVGHLLMPGSRRPTR